MRPLAAAVPPDAAPCCLRPRNASHNHVPALVGGCSCSTSERGSAKAKPAPRAARDHGRRASTQASRARSPAHSVATHSPLFGAVRSFQRVTRATAQLPSSGPEVSGGACRGGAARRSVLSLGCMQQGNVRGGRNRALKLHGNAFGCSIDSLQISRPICAGGMPGAPRQRCTPPCAFWAAKASSQRHRWQPCRGPRATPFHTRAGRQAGTQAGRRPLATKQRPLWSGTSMPCHAACLSTHRPPAGHSEGP